MQQCPKSSLPIPRAPRRGGVTRERRPATHDGQAPDAWERLQRLITEGQQLLGGTRGKSHTPLKQDLRTARRLLEGTRRTQLNKRGRRVLRETQALLETSVAGAQKAQQQRQKTSGEYRRPNRPVVPSKPDQQKHTARPPKAQRTTDPTSAQDVRQRLIAVAQAAGTTHWLLLAGGKSTPQEMRLKLLSQIEDRSGSDSPLLSALVVAPDGGPIPYFREILKEVGLEVPRSHEALLRIWRREQERAHAAYASPPRPMPPRLVPRKAATDAAHKPAGAG